MTSAPPADVNPANDPVDDADSGEEEEYEDDADSDVDDDAEEEFDEDDVADDDYDGNDTSPDTSRSEALKRRRIQATGGKTVKPLGRGGTTKTTSGNLTKGGAPKRILAQQRRRDALELRKMGVTYAKIAEATGYPSANEARTQVLKAYNEIIQEPAVELRQLQVERLNALLTIAWTQARGGSLSAINTCIALMTRIDVLNGTEAAIKMEVTQTTNVSIIKVDATQDEFISNMKRFLNVNADGTNKVESLTPEQQAALAATGTIPVQAAIEAPKSKYPPGMEPKPARHEIIEDAVEVLDEEVTVGAAKKKTVKVKRSLKISVIADDEEEDK